MVEHDDGSQSIDAHLDAPTVSVGDVVLRGDEVGLSDGTGSSGSGGGPHAHVARQVDCGATFCQTLSTTFADVGIPVTGQDVTSGNCP